MYGEPKVGNSTIWIWDDLGDLGVYSLESEFFHSDEPTKAKIAGLLYTAVMGIGFIAIGLGLYDRFAEVD